MESPPRQQVERIDEIVFPEGVAAALTLRLDTVPQGAAYLQSGATNREAGTQS
jgi:hypothetical protein